MKARIVLSILVPLLVVAAGFGIGELLASLRTEAERSAPEALPPLVAVARPHKGTVTFTVRAHGEVTPRTELELVAEVSGRVLWTAPTLVDGGFFEEGEPLVGFDERDFELALARADLELARARRRLAEEEAAAEQARREWERLGRGEGSALALREPQLAEVRAEVGAAQAELELRRRDLDRTQLRAPFACIVHAAAVETGQYATRGQVLARLWAIDYAEVRLPLPDEGLAFLDLARERSERGAGAFAPELAIPVTLRAQLAGQEHTWQGTVVRTESSLDPRTRMLVAVARVEDPYGLRRSAQGPPLAVGSFVAAELEGRSLEDALTLPREALRGADRVWVIDGEDRLRFRTVEVLRAGTGGLVIGAGLEEDERVVVTPLELATDGQRVRVRELELGAER